MIRVSRIIELLEQFAPVSTQEAWDNSGWQINLENQNAGKIMLAVSVTKDVVEQAVETGCDMILAHHPMFFGGVKSIEDEVAILAVKNNIQVYSSHTCLDKAIGGVTDALCLELGYNDFYSFNDFVRIVDLEQEVILDDLVGHIKDSLGIAKVKIVNRSAKNYVKKVAIGAGACAGFVPELIKLNVDLFITSDIKYHEALSAKDVVLFDVGHLESERPVLEVLRNIFANEGVELIIAQETPIFTYV